VVVEQERLDAVGSDVGSPGFAQGSHGPVGVSVGTMRKLFCVWLTKQEQAAGRLPSGMVYRLPTDEGRSVAVGLSQEKGDTHEDKSAKVLVFPWGSQWPPPKGGRELCRGGGTLGLGRD
jgi:hypothetical protein